MSNLQTLEELAGNLGAFFRESPPAQPADIEITGKTAEELESEIGKLSAGTAERVAHFDTRVKELSALLDKPFYITYMKTLTDARIIIYDLQSAISSIESAKQMAEKLTEGYRQRKLSEAGFKSHEDIFSQIDSLQAQRTEFRQKYFGGFRFRSQIRDINHRISSLCDLSHTQHDSFRLAEVGYSGRMRLEDTQYKLFKRFSNELFFVI